MNPSLRADLLPLLKVGMEFDTKEQLEKYLKEHPDADKSKHSVKKQEEKPKKKVVPTQTNIYAMWSVFQDNPDKVITQVAPADTAHIKRCIDAGLLELAPGKKGYRLSEEGKAAFKKESERWEEIEKKKQGR